jgi:hypothetical protein
MLCLHLLTRCAKHSDILQGSSALQIHTIILLMYYISVLKVGGVHPVAL